VGSMTDMKHTKNTVVAKEILMVLLQANN
jgi:hypothetical protein